MRFFSILIYLITSSLFCQTLQLSDKAEVSILTCAPGQNELYSQFGHSAMRVKDPLNGLDKVYNYGTFNFNQPNFYLKFCRGKLLYELSSYDYKYFPYRYYKENRWVKSQVINLTKQEVQKVYNFLEWNALPENKQYYYDFFYDNCANKMYEVLEKSVGEINFDYTGFPENYSHRDLIHLYLGKNNWGKFGIDLALGAIIDKKATFKQYMFLPDFVHTGMNNSTIAGKKIVSKDSLLLPDYNLEIPGVHFLWSPVFVALLLLTISLLLLLLKKKTKRWFNFLIFIYGITGLIVFALWFLTDHSTTKMNFNILWANPLLLIIPFLKKQLKQKISIVIAVMWLGFIIIALVGYQAFSLPIYLFAIGLLPVYFKFLKPN